MPTLDASSLEAYALFVLFLVAVAPHFINVQGSVLWVTYFFKAEKLENCFLSSA